MKINQDNYEQYFLDHAEGSLSAEMERELADFLEANPDLKALLADFDPSPLPSSHIHNEALKKRLKRKVIPTGHIHEKNAEEWMISQMEGLLDEKEEKELAEFIALNPAYAYDQEKFRQASFVPDLSVRFTHKEQLKKKAVILPVARIAWLIPAAAAVVLLFFGIRYLQQPLEVITNPAIKPLADVAVPIEPAKEIVADHNMLNKATAMAEIPSPSALTSVVQTKVTRPVSIRLEPSDPGTIEITPAYVSAGISMVEHNLSPVRISETREKPLIAKVFANMLDQAREGIRHQAKLENIDKNDISLWGLAKAGINGYNSISDRELELYVHRDEEGKVTSYALIEQDRLLMEKNLGKN